MADQSPKTQERSFSRGVLLWSTVLAALVGIAFTFIASTSIPSVSLFSPSEARFPSASSQLIEIVKARRTYYALDNTLPIGEEKVTHIVEELVQAVPSAFNSQSNRVVILFSHDHLKLWDIVTSILKAESTSEEQWEATSQKMAAFRAGAGTILFFEDQDTISDLQRNFPRYSETFPVWAAHSDGMLQHAVWTALEAEGLGANLQHYNPLIDGEVTRTWDLPASWTLRAQMVFGGRAGTPGKKTYKPLEGKLKVFGTKS